jgi:SNF2 family DNA or RNA helicase
MQRAGIYGPFLVIAPLSTIANWQREFESWSDFNVVIYHGSIYSRRLINEYELYYRDASGKVITDAFKFNVIVTTYEVMLGEYTCIRNS